MPKPAGLKFEVWPHQDDTERKITLKASTDDRAWSNIIVSSNRRSTPTAHLWGQYINPEEWENLKYLVDLAFRAWRLYFEQAVSTVPETSTTEGLSEEKTMWQRLVEDD